MSRPESEIGIAFADELSPTDIQNGVVRNSVLQAKYKMERRVAVIPHLPPNLTDLVVGTREDGNGPLHQDVVIYDPDQTEVQTRNIDLKAINDAEKAEIYHMTHDDDSPWHRINYPEYDRAVFWRQQG